MNLTSKICDGIELMSRNTREIYLTCTVLISNSIELSSCFGSSLYLVSKIDLEVEE